MLVSKKNFNNLKIHTQYSICEGAIKIDALADYCKLNKIKSIGLADSFNLCGALEFSEKLSKVGTQPIIGTQINLKEHNIIGKITLYAKSSDALRLVEEMPKVYSEPFADSSQIPTFFVCASAAQKVKVCLSGDGGDEVFGGYNRYRYFHTIYPKLKRVPNNLLKNRFNQF